MKKRILLALLLVLLAGAGLCLMADRLYWAGPHLEDAVLDLTDYRESIAEHDGSLGDIEAAVHRCNEEAVPVRPALTAFFDACNGFILRYFSDVYQTDLSAPMDALQVMESTYPEEIAQMVGGSHSSDFPGKLFLNAGILDGALSEQEGPPDAAGAGFSEKMLRTVYIHEVMHYLGFNSDTGFSHFTEALAEALNQEVIRHSGIKYESITGYAPIQGFAAQILACDPGLVRDVLSKGPSGLADSFNDRLNGGTGFDYAGYYDQLIGLLQKGERQKLGTLKFYTQYLTYEYCKTAGSGAKEALRTGPERAVPGFALRWLLNAL